MSVVDTGVTPDLHYGWPLDSKPLIPVSHTSELTEAIIRVLDRASYFSFYYREDCARTLVLMVQDELDSIFTAPHEYFDDDSRMKVGLKTTITIELPRIYSALPKEVKEMPRRLKVWVSFEHSGWHVSKIKIHKDAPRRV